jgi:hypothetical protein
VCPAAQPRASYRGACVLLRKRARRGGGRKEIKVEREKERTNKERDMSIILFFFVQNVFPKILISSLEELLIIYKTSYLIPFNF